MGMRLTEIIAASIGSQRMFWHSGQDGDSETLSDRDLALAIRAENATYRRRVAGVLAHDGFSNEERNHYLGEDRVEHEQRLAEISYARERLRDAPRVLSARRAEVTHIFLSEPNPERIARLMSVPDFLALSPADRARATALVGRASAADRQRFQNEVLFGTLAMVRSAYVYSTEIEPLAHEIVPLMARISPGLVPSPASTEEEQGVHAILLQHELDAYFNLLGPHAVEICTRLVNTSHDFSPSAPRVARALLRRATLTPDEIRLLSLCVRKTQNAAVEFLEAAPRLRALLPSDDWESLVEDARQRSQYQPLEVRVRLGETYTL